MMASQRALKGSSYTDAGRTATTPDDGTQSQRLGGSVDMKLSDCPRRQNGMVDTYDFLAEVESGSNQLLPFLDEVDSSVRIIYRPRSVALHFHILTFLVLDADTVSSARTCAQFDYNQVSVKREPDYHQSTVKREPVDHGDKRKRGPENSTPPGESSHWYHLWYRRPANLDDAAQRTTLPVRAVDNKTTKLRAGGTTSLRTSQSQVPETKHRRHCDAGCDLARSQSNIRCTSPTGRMVNGRPSTKRAAKSDQR